MKYIYILLCGASMLLCKNTNGQGVTTASISGKVTTESGEAMPGASIVAVHGPSGTSYGSSTRNDGRFNLPNLRIGGPYQITVSFVGYESKKADNIHLKLGENLHLEFALKQASTELSEVVITASELMNKDKTGASAAYDNNTIRKMPTITRSASDIYRLTPSSDGNSFAGRNDQYNNFSLNGAIFNNPFGLDAATPGGQTDAQPISLDAIDQIQVAVAPFDVTQAGFTGASVNAVTKSGTNKISGTAFGFFRSDALTGSKVKGEKVFVPDLKQQQIGFSLGGPIVKDKAFFFVNFEMERRDDLGSSFVAARPGLTGSNVSRVSAADLDLVSFVLDSAFDYQTGVYEGFTHKTKNQKGIIKLDWNIGKNHTLTAIYNFLDASKQKPAHPAAIGRRGPDATTLQFYNSGYQINNKINSVLFELKSTFSNSYANKVQLGYTHFDDSRDPFSAVFPVVSIQKDGIRYIVAGHEPFSIHNLLDQKVIQFSDNFEAYVNNHTLTAGVSFEKFEFDNSFNLNAYGGTFGDWPTVQAFVNEVRTGAFDDDVAAAEARQAQDLWATPETNVGQLAFYLQDKWRIKDNFTLTLGIRMDKPMYFDTSEKIEESIAQQQEINGGFNAYDPSVIYYDEDDNQVQFDHTVLPDATPLFSPRLGVNWDVNSDGKTIVRGGTGLFTGRFPFVWIGNQVANPNFYFYCMTANDFQFPQVWRTSLGIDKAFGEGWIATADFMYTKDVNAMMVRNYGINSPGGTLQGADNRPIYTGADRVVPYANNAYIFTNTNIGRTLNLTFELKRNWAKGLYTSLAYNYLDAQDASSIEAEISSDAYDRNPAFGNVNQAVLAPSVYGNKHRIVGTANKTIEYGQGKFATTFSLFFEYAQGGRFSYTYSGDLNRDGSGLNDLIYIPTAAELAAPTMVFSGTPTEQNAQKAAFEAYISNDEYLSGRRGQYAEKYAVLSPWYSRWDLRILQDYKVKEGHTLQLSVDLLNLGNLISSEWGVRQIPTNSQPVGVSVDPAGIPTYSFDPNLTNTFSYDAGLISRWQVQFGLRYSF